MINLLLIILSELYQLSFVASVTLLLYTIADIGIKVYAKFVVKDESVKLIFTDKFKITILVALSIIISYIL